MIQAMLHSENSSQNSARGYSKVPVSFRSTTTTESLPQNLNFIYKKSFLVSGRKLSSKASFHLPGKTNTSNEPLGSSVPVSTEQRAPRTLSCRCFRYQKWCFFANRVVGLINRVVSKEQAHRKSLSTNRQVHGNSW